MSSPRIALVGVGYWGKNLLRNFAELGALQLVCDADQELLANRTGTYPGVATTTSFEAVLESDVDAVVIATPAAMHYAHAKAVLESGKDVFVEKPLALTFRDGRELVNLAAARDAILMVGHILEFHPAIARLEALVREGELGAVRYLYSNRLNLGKVRQEENILWSFAPHDIAVICGLVGSTPVRVSASGGAYLQDGVVDVTVTNLEFASGVRSHIFVSWLHPYKEQRLVVIGDKKMAVFDDTATAQKLRVYDKGIVWEGGLPVPRERAETAIFVPNTEPLKLECEHFLEAVANRTRPRTDGESALRVLAVLEAAQTSLESGGAPAPVESSESGLAEPIPLTIASRQAEPEDAPIASDVFVHPTAFVDAGAQIGPGTRIWHFSHVMQGANIGDGCSLGQNVFVGDGVRIGHNVKIQNNVSVYSGVLVEDDAFLGPSMVFTNVMNPRSHVPRKDEYQVTRVGRGASVGANATIVCGTRLGRYSFVGAGAVVTRNVADYALVVGNPARQQGWMCQCGERITLDSLGDIEHGQCERCGDEYVLVEDTLMPKTEAPEWAASLLEDVDDVDDVDGVDDEAPASTEEATRR